MKKYLFFILIFLENNYLLSYLINNSIVIIQMEDRKNNLLDKFMYHNKIISEKYNIKYINIKKSLFNVPPYWAKIFEIKKIINENPSINYFIWLDSDAFLFSFNYKKLQNFLLKFQNYSIIMTWDMPPWTGKFNAGSFIIKNDKNSKNILNKWISYYNSSKWKFQNNNWITNSEWAGIDYEQKSFVIYILENKKYKNFIIQLPYYYLNNNNCTSYKDNTYIVHLAKKHKENINVVQSCLEIIKIKYL